MGNFGDNERDEIIYRSYIEEILKPEKINIKEFEKNIEFINDNNISKRNSLKPNLRNNIFMGKHRDTGEFYYYFKSSENFVTRFILSEEAFKIFNGNNENDIVESKRLKITSTLILIYYKEMIGYYQEKAAELKIEEMYEGFEEERLKEVEKIIKEIMIFFAKVYYRHPIYEERETSKYLEYLMEKYNITDQINELEKTLNFIREIGIYQLKRKEEKEKEREEKTREKWNIIFAVIGTVIALGEIFLAVTELFLK
ncbi:hypothetical protein EII29_09355 [Leptotrichia sp. OH3620_COT-345]|uniref:hypothetical protein n=1 Tax=Leptotrichia sp. OH3620_COT-345 TaxID=2491048 RepID=UPI000F652493|nr:hypothetical protein [Leptotrichia sp. OH3620_COT-345]RRD38897.1 hypothetical protein EII29_09355 [Leptotrichia sp. OH3620_COT-345]